MAESKLLEKQSLAFLFGLFLLQLAMLPCLFGALYFWSVQKQAEGWYILALGYVCMIVSKLLAPKKVKENTDGTSSTD